MVIREKRYTAHEFWQIARQPAYEGHRLELDEGVIVDMASSKPINTVIAGRVIYFFNAYVIPRDLGYVTVPDGGFKLGTHKVRQPDAAFISKVRLPVLPEDFELAPDLAVEIVSENEDIFKKAREYLAAGTQQVWAIYPDERTVYVLSLDEDGRLVSTAYDSSAVLSGGTILPGFTVAVRDLFPD